MKNWIIFFILLIFPVSVFAGEIKIPDGWKLPENKLFKTEWIDDNHNAHLKAEADFDGNGILDVALILELKEKIGFGVFVFLSQPNNMPTNTIKLFSTNDDPDIKSAMEEHPGQDFISAYLISYGVKVAKPGKYLTACGKGFWECGEIGSESKEINLKLPAIDFFHFDAGDNLFFYWDSRVNKFRFMWMSD
jgi:hypothetical protein